jgi:HAD superfamily hydrolase (TIGR01509 family)
MEFRAILFDMDGVISNTEPLHEKVDRLILKEFGAEMDSRWGDSIRGLRELDVYKKAIELYGIDSAPEDMFKEKVKLFEKYKQEIIFFTGVKETLQFAKKNFKIALVSSSPRGIVKLVLKQGGLDSFFETIVSGDDVSAGKPDPEPYAKAAKELGVNPVNCIGVEDSIFGIRSVKSAGMTCIGLQTSFKKEQVLAAGVDYVVNDIRDLPALVSTVSNNK